MSSKKNKRDTRWDEPDTTSGRPLVPKAGEAIRLTSGVSGVEPTNDQLVPKANSASETRVSVNKLVDSQPSIRHEDGEIIIPVVEEKMVLVKKMVLTEEIHLQLEQEEESITIKEHTASGPTLAKSKRS